MVHRARQFKIASQPLNEFNDMEKSLGEIVWRQSRTRTYFAPYILLWGQAEGGRMSFIGRNTGTDFSTPLEILQSSSTRNRREIKRRRAVDQGSSIN